MNQDYEVSYQISNKKAIKGLEEKGPSMVKYFTSFKEADEFNIDSEYSYLSFKLIRRRVCLFDRANWKKGMLYKQVIPIHEAPIIYKFHGQYVNKVGYFGQRFCYSGSNLKEVWAAMKRTYVQKGELYAIYEINN